MLFRTVPKSRPNFTARYSDLLFLLAVMAGFFWISRYNYVLFHSLVEAASAAVTFSAFAFAWNTRSFEHGYLLLVGLACGFLGVIGVLHALAFKGMGVFPGYGPDLPTQLWIASRYLTALTLLVAPYFLHRSLPIVPAFLTLFGITSALVASIFLGYFPRCFIEGEGLTTFKIVSEYVICGLLLLAMALMLRNRSHFDRATRHLLCAYFGFSIACGLAFTSYLGVYDFSNLVGHLLQLLSSYFFYKAIVEKGFRQPVEFLFRELKDAVQARDEFISIASHELKTPLTPLRLQLQNFQRLIQSGRADELTPEKIDRTVNLSIKQIDRMSYLVENLMDSTRLSTGKFDLNCEKVALFALLREITERHKPEQIASRCELSLLAPSEEIHLQADVIRLEQVVTNLFINALKYAPGTKIEIGALTKPDGRKLIWIHDAGPGIPAHAQDRIFLRYERLNHSDRSGGLGLGLYISREIVEAHGGSLKLESSPGKGSRFEILLP